MHCECHRNKSESYKELYNKNDCYKELYNKNDCYKELYSKTFTKLYRMHGQQVRSYFGPEILVVRIYTKQYSKHCNLYQQSVQKVDRGIEH